MTTGNAGEVLAAVKKLASFHTALMEYQGARNGDFQNPEHVFADEMRRHNRELRCVRELHFQKEEENAFEELFWRCFRSILPRPRRWLVYPAWGSRRRASAVSATGLQSAQCDRVQRNSPCIINLEQMRWMSR